MGDMRLGMVEAHFADIVWHNAPLTTKELVELCSKPPLNWKRTTTYTVLKKLCLRGIFEMQDGTVTVKITKEQFRSIQSDQFVEENFRGSLPAFLTAFNSRKKLSEADIDELQKLIDQMRG